MLQERSANGNSGSEIDEILMFPIAAGLAGLGDDGASGDDLVEVKDKELSPYLLLDIGSLLAVERQETYGVLKVTEGCLQIPSEMIQILEAEAENSSFSRFVARNSNLPGATSIQTMRRRIEYWSQSSEEKSKFLREI